MSRAERDARYNRSEKGRARWRRYARKAIQTPGTYRYQEAHGIGLPGAKKRERYYNLSGFEYNRLLLRQRRNSGLARMKARNQRRQEEIAAREP